MRVGCLASFAFVCLGLWLMIDYGLELVWGSPGITHINVTVLVCTGQRSRRSVARGNINQPNVVKSKLRRLQYGVALTASASALCVVFCILAVIRLPPTGQQPSQCAFASVFLFPKAYLRLKRSREVRYDLNSHLLQGTDHGHRLRDTRHWRLLCRQEVPDHRLPTQQPPSLLLKITVRHRDRCSHHHGQHSLVLLLRDHATPQSV